MKLRVGIALCKRPAGGNLVAYPSVYVKITDLDRPDLVLSAQAQLGEIEYGEIGLHARGEPPDIGEEFRAAPAPVPVLMANVSAVLRHFPKVTTVEKTTQPQLR